MGAIRIFSIWWFLFIFFIKWQRWCEVLCLINCNHEKIFFRFFWWKDLPISLNSAEMESKWFCKYKSTKKCIPLTYVITHCINGDFIFFIPRSTSLRVVCYTICNVQYLLQLIFNLQLKNEHVRGVGLMARYVFHRFFFTFFVFWA